MVELPGLDNEHPTRMPGWGMSIYNPPTFERDRRDATVAKGAHPPAPMCPCRRTADSSSSDQVECVVCETWCCSRCKRWCSWEMGHSECSLCDDCCVYLGACDE